MLTDTTALTRARFFTGTSVLVYLALMSGPLLAQSGNNGALEEIQVTGSRIQRTGFTTPTPVTTFSNDYMQDLGVVDVGEMVNQLPASQASLTPETNGWGSFNVGAQRVNLRALGPTRSLVLVDGRRFVPSTNEGDVDMSLIPSILTQRVDVVTGGASAAYGSDAVAGVVNIILNKDLTGLRLDLDTGISARGDGETYHAAFAGGTGFADDRGHVIIGGEYEKDEGIGSCLEHSSWCDDLPGIVTNVGNAANGEPRYIRTKGVRLAGATTGGVLVGVPNPVAGGSPLAFPAGSPLAGPDADHLWQFDETAALVPYVLGDYVGRTKAGGDGPSYLATTQIRVPYERVNIFGHADYALSDTLNSFVEASFGDTSGHNYGAATWWTGGGAIPIARDNYFLPDAVGGLMDDAGIDQVAVGRYGIDMHQNLSTSDNTVYRIAAGFDGQFSQMWRWDVYYQYGHDHRYQSIIGDRLNTNFSWAVDAVADPATGEPTCRVLLEDSPPEDAMGCVPFDIFGPNNWSPEAKDYAFGTVQEWFNYDQHVISGNVQGELFDAGGGPVAVAAGLEYRKENGEIYHNAQTLTFNFWQNYGQDYEGSVAITEGYMEVDVPLAQGASWANYLDINIAGRQTHYKKRDITRDIENGIDATTWKISGVYEPTTWLRFRATRSRDVRAPNFQELYSRTRSVLGIISNPWRLTDQNPLTDGGGNVNLHEEQGDTLTLGVVFQPQWGISDGLRLSVDYFDIDIEGAIGTLGAQNIVNRCYEGYTDLCQYVERDAANNILSIQNVNLNLDSYKVKGIDIEALYPFVLGDLGAMTMRVMATRTIDQIQNIGGTSIDYAGQNTGSGTPSWILNATATFNSGPFGTTLQARYIDGGYYDVTYVGPQDEGYDPALPNSINDNRVDSALYFNLTARYAFAFGNDRSVEIFGVINNLLDKKPPLAEQNAYPTNPTYYDQVGMAFRGGLRIRY